MNHFIAETVTSLWIEPLNFSTKNFFFHTVLPSPRKFWLRCCKLLIWLRLRDNLVYLFRAFPLSLYPRYNKSVLIRCWWPSSGEVTLINISKHLNMLESSFWCQIFDSDRRVRSRTMISWSRSELVFMSNRRFGFYLSSWFFSLWFQHLEIHQRFTVIFCFWQMLKAHSCNKWQMWTLQTGLTS